MDKHPRQRTKKSILLNILYILLTIAALVVFGLLDENVGDIFEVIGSLNRWFIYAAAGAMVIHWLLDSIALKYIIGFMHEGIGWLKAFKLAIVGFYYSALTPFSSGGQPVQVFYMHKDGIPVGKSTATFSVKFLSFQISLCLYFIISLILKGTKFFVGNRDVFLFTMIGFVANAVLTLLVLIVVSDRFPVKRWADKLINWLHTKRIIKRPEKIRSSLLNTIDEFVASAKFMRSDRRMLIGSITISIAQMMAQFAITYFVYRSFGFAERTLMDVVAMQAFHYLAVCFVPIPGAAIASEGGFYLFFQMFFPANKMYVAMLIWRLFTYYANIIVGAVVVLSDSVGNMLKRPERANR